MRYAGLVLCCVLLVACGDDEVVDANGDGAAYGPVVWGCSVDVPGIAVGPGESRTDTLTIEGPGVTVSESSSPIGAEEEGFRLAYFVGDARDPTPAPFIADAVTSNVFEVRLAQAVPHQPARTASPARSR